MSLPAYFQRFIIPEDYRVIECVIAEDVKLFCDVVCAVATLPDYHYRLLMVQLSEPTALVKEKVRKAFAERVLLRREQSCFLANNECLIDFMVL